MTTKTMKCVYASNSLRDSAYVMGKSYTATREDGKVFVSDEWGMKIQVSMNESHEGRAAWGCVVRTAYGADHFKFVIEG